jgi:hypothetical protein
MKIQEVYNAKVVYKDDNTTIIKWSADTGFGQLTIEYNGRGGYCIDAEYLSIESVIKIMQKL